MGDGFAVARAVGRAVGKAEGTALGREVGASVQKVRTVSTAPVVARMYPMLSTVKF